MSHLHTRRAAQCEVKTSAQGGANHRKDAQTRNTRSNLWDVESEMNVAEMNERHRRSEAEKDRLTGDQITKIDNSRVERQRPRWRRDRGAAVEQRKSSCFLSVTI
jgi:hypothetical protein